MTSRFEGNEDWIKREKGVIPTKGAMAAERASAGLGTSGDDAESSREASAPISLWAKPPQKSAPTQKK
jgi:hypothetical protein